MHRRIHKLKAASTSGHGWDTSPMTAMVPPHLIDIDLFRASRRDREAVSAYSMKVEQARNQKQSGRCSTLKHLAVGSIIRNMHRMTFEALDAFSSHPSILEEIWLKLVDMQYVTFDAWLIFNRLFMGKSPLPGLRLFEQYISVPKAGLAAYTNPLTSLTFDFLACLTITVTFPVQHLLKLTKFRNLGALALSGSGAEARGDPSQATQVTGVVNDRLFRAWSEAAMGDEKAFPVLRVLRLTQCPEVTVACLPHLSLFPILGLFDIGVGNSRISSFDEETQMDQWTRLRPYKSSNGVNSALLPSAASELEKDVQAFGIAAEVNTSASQISEFSTMEARRRRSPAYYEFLDLGVKRKDLDLQHLTAPWGKKGDISPPPVAIIHIGKSGIAPPEQRYAFIRGDFGIQRRQRRDSDVFVSSKGQASSNSRTSKQKRSAPESKRRPLKKQKLGDMLGMFQ